MDFIKSYGFILIVTLLSVIALVYSLLLQRKIKAIKVDNERLEVAKKQNLADIYLNPNKCNLEEGIKNLTDSFDKKMLVL